VLGGTALAAASLLASRASLAKQDRSHSGLARIDGSGIYYEVHGALDRGAVPLVLLHGGALTIEVAFTPQLIARFARRQPVIAIEQQGHGHTADRPDRPMTLDQMIRDTAGVLAHLKVRQADLFGHSLGGMIATGVAIRHPEIVRNVTTLGAPYLLEGFREELVRIQRDANATPSPELAKLLPTEADFVAWRLSFQRVAPDPQAFDSALERLNTMLTNWTGWSSDELKSIRAAALIAIGDNDYVRIDHAAEVARLIPNARLAVLPGMTHLGVVKRDAWLEPMMQTMGQAEL
jgi:pimeloyl-ACP methyl ester carboxylesterase